MGPRQGMERGNLLLHRGLNPATVQPLPSRYNDYAIPVPSSSSTSNSRSTLSAKEEKRNFLHKNNIATNLDPNTTNVYPA
jgi:hypothetical protein